LMAPEMAVAMISLDAKGCIGKALLVLRSLSANPLLVDPVLLLEFKPVVVMASVGVVALPVAPPTVVVAARPVVVEAPLGVVDPPLVVTAAVVLLAPALVDPVVLLAPTVVAALLVVVASAVVVAAAIIVGASNAFSATCNGLMAFNGGDWQMRLRKGRLPVVMPPRFQKRRW